MAATRLLSSPPLQKEPTGISGSAKSLFFTERIKVSRIFPWPHPYPQDDDPESRALCSSGQILLPGYSNDQRGILHFRHISQAHGPQFRAKVKPPVFVAIIKRFDANGVSGQHEALFLFVKNGKSKHAVKRFNTSWTFFLVKMKNGFGVGLGCKRILARQVRSDGLEIVNFTVDNNPFRFWLVKIGWWPVATSTIESL